MKYKFDTKLADNMKSPEQKPKRQATRTHNGVTYEHNVNLKKLRIRKPQLKHNKLNHLHKPKDNSVQ